MFKEINMLASFEYYIIYVCIKTLYSTPNNIYNFSIFNY